MAFGGTRRSNVTEDDDTQGCFYSYEGSVVKAQTAVRAWLQRLRVRRNKTAVGGKTTGAAYGSYESPSRRRLERLSRQISDAVSRSR